MGRLDGRVAIVTGAGGGLGRSHAMRLAADGASVVVNDLGVELGGGGRDPGRADAVVREIRATGGHAVASPHDVADWEEAAEMVALAIETFGDLHVLVNNAGILRDRTLANLSEDEWDDSIRVLLKGHAAPSRHALAYWRDRAKAGVEVAASVIHTSSIAGLFGSFGQAHYATAKLGVLALSRVISIEAGKYGVRSNAIAPSARTRMTLSVGDERVQAPADGGFDVADPSNVSAVVAWLAHANCPADSQVFHVWGNRLAIIAMPDVSHLLETNGPWTFETLDREVVPRLVSPTTIEAYDRQMFR
jgi:NAD(P)-dependent dehydrogenase (short-subunit alcohol dehydrogenase family)